MTFCSNKIDEFLIKLDDLVSRVNDNNWKLLQVQNKCMKMQEEIDSLKRSHNVNEQLKLLNNLDICGIPKTTNGSLFDILAKLSNLVNVEVKEEDICKAYRTKTRNDSNNSTIVIFNNKNKKEELMKAFKALYKDKPIVATDFYYQIFIQTVST